jgi:hypothetical protein
VEEEKKREPAVIREPDKGRIGTGRVQEHPDLLRERWSANAEALHFGDRARSR